jgi:hypothetical protein
MKHKVFNAKTGKTTTRDIKHIAFNPFNHDAVGCVTIQGKRVAVEYASATDQWSVRQ